MHGQFVLVQLESEDEAVLGRITSLSAQGRLASSAGDDYGIRAVADDRPIPEDLREQYLRYKVNIRVLGVVRIDNDHLIFAASHRRLPHVGSKVAFLNAEVLKEIAGHNLEGAEIGFFALGEFIYAGNDSRLVREPWMQVDQSIVIPRFRVSDLVARRTFVFARAGFGKSNLVKLLFSHLYRETPTVQKRGERAVPVGTILFDPEGEYFWPDDRDRPGLCDVPNLKDRIVVFTNRQGPSRFYQSFVATGIRLDIRRLRPADVISIALSADRQDQQNVRKLRGLNSNDWKRVVDAVYKDGYAADDEIFRTALSLQPGQQDAELIAAKSNMTAIVRMLHDPSSQMMDMLLEALKQGKLCVVDISQLRGSSGLILSGLILKRIFDRNQEEFTKSDPQTIPTITVLEEAQSVLGSADRSGEGPYVSWVKEGRKYDLGAVLITQQPGSIPHELLSQGDNWFIFHLLSSGDLRAVRGANAHFSEDILSTLLNEPIPGHGVFWSSAGGKSYPIPFRALSFEHAYVAQDPNYERESINTFAAELRNRFEDTLNKSRRIQAELVEANGHSSETQVPSSASEGFEDGVNDIEDALETYLVAAIAGLRDDSELMSWLTGRRTGDPEVPWRGMITALERRLPHDMDDLNTIAHTNVARALNTLVGQGNWHTERKPRVEGGGPSVVWIKLDQPLV
jgi:DNA helicase HerA-like ATPase